MNLPDFPDLSPETLQAIAERHGLGGQPITRLQETGIVNAIFSLGDDVILRVSRNHPSFTAAVRKESIAVPLVRAAGVRTPELLAFDDTEELVPVPYSLYEQVHAATLGLLDLEPEATRDAWRELGRDLALLHAGVLPDGPASSLGPIEAQDLPDPRMRSEEMVSQGYFTASEARWFNAWLDRLAPARESVRQRFLHGNSQSTNVMVDSGTLTYRAVIDWGSAGWGDPAWDFSGIPLRAVPYMLEGYRERASLEGSEMLEARILWCHLKLALMNLRRGPQPGLSWAERPLGMFTDVMRFFAAPPNPTWRALGPPARP